MATTTNYSWDTPDDTDLVKDGAAAIRTLGSSIDTTTKALNPSTTLGDIEYRSSTANTNTRLGIGTTGQVLAVVGGVPAWATTADQTPLTTKGDLFTFDTADARLAVGANDTILVADSTAATGLKWGGTWTTFTPTWTNLTVGNSVQSFQYCIVGKVLFVQGAIKLGSTGSIGGALRMDVPVAYTMPTNGDFFQVCGAYKVYDASAGGEFVGSIVPSGGNLRFYGLSPDTVLGQTRTGAQVAGTSPMTWATDDILSIQYSLRAT
jgi:hypothetical protein